VKRYAVSVLTACLVKGLVRAMESQAKPAKNEMR